VICYYRQADVVCRRFGFVVVAVLTWFQMCCCRYELCRFNLLPFWLGTPESVISGPRWSVVSAVCHYSRSAMSAADATNWYGLLITVGGVGGDFSQTLYTLCSEKKHPLTFSSISPW